MPAGDLHFYTGPTLLDHLIDLAERLEGHAPAEAKVSHVAVEVAAGPRPGLPVVVEAVWPQVHEVARDPGAITIPWGWRYPQAARDRALAWLRDQAGDMYGWEDVADHVFHILAVPVELRDPKRMDCSHLVFAYMTLAGEDWATGARQARYPQAAKWPADPYLVSPADLYRYARALCAHEGQLP